MYIYFNQQNVAMIKVKNTQELMKERAKSLILSLEFFD